MLKGPYDLTLESIGKAVTPKRSGVFALGYVDNSGVFRIESVGRDMTDLQDRLRTFIGSSAQFKFKQMLTSQEAFDLECELFHKFRPRGNFIHPVRPQGVDWTCRHCHHRG